MKEKQTKTVRNLKGIVVEETSLVKWGANDMPIFIAKSVDATKNTTIQQISKIYDDYAYIDRDTNEPMHLLKAVWYRPNVADLQGDIASTQEVADSFYDFMKNSRQIKRNHTGDTGQGIVVEGYIANVDSIENGFQILKGDALIGIGVNETTYQAYLRGEIGGVSMGGYAKETEEIEVAKSVDNEKLGIIKSLAKYLGISVDIKKEVIEDDNKTITNSEDDMTREETDAIVKEAIEAYKVEVAKEAEPKVDMVTVEAFDALKAELTKSIELNKEQSTVIAEITKKQAETEKTIAKMVETSGEPTGTGSDNDAPTAPITKTFADFIGK